VQDAVANPSRLEAQELLPHSQFSEYSACLRRDELPADLVPAMQGLFQYADRNRFSERGYGGRRPGRPGPENQNAPHLSDRCKSVTRGASVINRPEAFLT